MDELGGLKSPRGTQQIQPEAGQQQAQQPVRRRRRTPQPRPRLSTPEPVEGHHAMARYAAKRAAFVVYNLHTHIFVGRQHMEVQTLNYLEEITDRPDEREVETQTDAMKDRLVNALAQSNRG